MNGLIALLGSGEYLPVMDAVDRYLLDSLKIEGRKPRVICLATAAGREGDGSINRWSTMGIAHFQALGADVTALPIIDRESADDPQWDPSLENADLIYFSGGDPNYLHQTLKGSRAWSSAMKAWERGAIYAGCSAGAMILSRRIPSFRLFGTIEGFDIVPVQFILPHFDAVPVIFKPLISSLKAKLKGDECLLGIDEDTALIGRPAGTWTIMGSGTVHVITRAGTTLFKNGESLTLA